MAEFATRTRRHFGKPRTYVVDAASGEQIGYRDNLTGALVAVDLMRAGRLSRWAALAGASSAVAGVVPTPGRRRG
jgi:hypothetical protein